MENEQPGLGGPVSKERQPKNHTNILVFVDDVPDARRVTGPQELLDKLPEGGTVTIDATSDGWKNIDFTHDDPAIEVQLKENIQVVGDEFLIYGFPLSAAQY